MYLYELYVPDSFPATTNVLKKLCEKYNIKDKQFKYNGSVNSSICVQAANGRWFDIAEFSGNCSALVLYNIEIAISMDKEKEIFDFTIDLCKELKYACLFVTVTFPEMVEYLINKYNFIQTSTFINDHSGRRNYFLQKFITEDAKQEVTPINL